MSELPGPLDTSGGLQILPHCSFADYPRFDVLIIVGGVHEAEMTKSAVLAWIAGQLICAQSTASVCTAVFLLAAAGVITDHRVTTHWEDLDDLK